MKTLADFFNELESTAKEVEKIGKQAGIESESLGLASVLTAIQLMAESRAQSSGKKIGG